MIVKTLFQLAKPRQAIGAKVRFDTDWLPPVIRCKSHRAFTMTVVTIIPAKVVPDPEDVIRWYGMMVPRSEYRAKPFVRYILRKRNGTFFVAGSATAQACRIIAQEGPNERKRSKASPPRPKVGMIGFFYTSESPFVRHGAITDVAGNMMRTHGYRDRECALALPPGEAASDVVKRLRAIAIDHRRLTAMVDNAALQEIFQIMEGAHA